MRRPLIDFALNLSEQDYRKYKAISYSRIKSYLTKGAGSLIAEPDEESESMAFGKLVDTLLTQRDLLDSLYYVVDIPNVPPKVLEVINIAEQSEIDLNIIDNNDLDSLLSSADYYNNYKPETRIKKFREDSSELLRVTSNAGNRIIVTTSDFTEAHTLFKSIITAPFAEVYFPELTDDIEIFYQIQFAAYFNGIKVKCMFDKIIVNHTKKYITLIDFKTTSDLEIDFIKPLFKFKYYIQAELYRYILSEVLDEDSYYSEFTISPFTFIVGNKVNLCPIAWEYPLDANHTDWMNAIKEMDINFSTGQFKYYPSTLDNKAILQLNINDKSRVF